MKMLKRVVERGSLVDITSAVVHCAVECTIGHCLTCSLQLCDVIQEHVTQ